MRDDDMRRPASARQQGLRRRGRGALDDGRNPTEAVRTFDLRYRIGPHLTSPPRNRPGPGPVLGRTGPHTRCVHRAHPCPGTGPGTPGTSTLKNWRLWAATKVVDLVQQLFEAVFTDRGIPKIRSCSGLDL